MQTDPGQKLTAALGVDLAVIGELNDAEAADLLDMLTAAKLVRAATLDASIAEVLGHLPRLVRIPARKIVFG